MGRQWILQEVEEEKNDGCGSIIVMIIIVVIGVLGGFKACGKDSDSTEKTIEQVQPASIKREESQTSSEIPKSTSISTSKETESAEPQIEMIKKSESESYIHNQKADSEDSPSINIETNTEISAPTEKERRKAERKAKRESRRKDKMKNDN